MKYGAELLYAMTVRAHIMTGRECLEFIRIKKLKILDCNKLEEFKNLKMIDWVQGSEHVNKDELKLMETWTHHYTNRNDPWILTTNHKRFKIWKQLIAIDELTVQRQKKYRRKRTKQQLLRQEVKEAVVNG